MQTNYEREIELFYNKLIKPQLPPDTSLYQSTAKPKMHAWYDNTAGKVHFCVECPRNPIYAIDKFYYDCGEYYLTEILSFAYTYDNIKITKTRG